jgi:hypothetical protein
MRFVSSVVLLVFLVPFSLLAQSNATDSALEGYVADRSGSGIPNAVCVAVNQATGLRLEVTSNQDGYYRFPLLPIGTYSLTVSRPGFKEYRQSGITLSVGRQIRVDVVLEVGDVVESVTVEADASVVDVARPPAMQEVVGERALRTLPIVSRNLFNMNLLGPGVKGVPSSGFGTTQFSFGGLQRTTWAADGMDNTQRRFGRQIRLVIYTPEAIEEVQVVGGTYSAEFGRAAGGLINIITKSGTNEYHGQGLFLYRPEATNARPGLSATKPEQEWKNLTGTVGGPIRKDKLFFFAQYEWNPLVIPRPVTITPANAQALNLPPAEVAPAMFGEEFHTAMGKINFELNPKNRGFLRYSRFTNDSPYNGGGGLTIVSRSLTFTDRMNGGAGQLATIISPTLLNEFRFGVNRRQELRVQQGNPSPQDAFINITGVANIGNNLGNNNTSVETSTQFVNNLTWTRGRHTIKGGVDYQTTAFQQQRAINRTFVFGGLPVAGGRPAVTPLQQYLNTLNRVIDPATGRPFTYTQLQQDIGDPNVDERFQFVNFFLQDEYRLSPRLTLNLGLRYELILYPELDPEAPLPLSRTVNRDTNNWAPRLGFSWSPFSSNRTVVRGGYGTYFDTPNLGLFLDASVLNGRRLLSYAVPGTDANAPAFPNLLAPGSPGLRATAPNVNAFSPDLQTLYAHQVTFQIEQAVTSALSVNLQYQWMATRQGLFSLDANLPAPVGRLADGRPLFSGTTGRPNPAFRIINLIQSGGNTNYNALDITVRQRFAKGLQFSATYSYSNALGDSQQSGASPQDPTNRRADYGPLNANVRHNLVLQGFWAPTFQAPALKWFNGTEFASIIFANSGYPVDVSAGADLNGDLVLNDRPLFLGRNSVVGPSFFQWDVRLTRRIPFGERYELQLIAETENFTNRLNPACTPEGGCSGAVVRLGSAADFGRLTAARSARVFQFGARFRF